MTTTRDPFLSLANRGLAYWRLMEAFTPQNLPKVKALGLPRTAMWDAAKRPPWDPSSEFARSNSRPPRGSTKVRKFRHTLYAGVYRIPRLLECLDRFFAPDPRVFAERPDSRTALCKFDVDHDGAPVAGTLVVSSAAWSTGVLLKANNPELIGDLGWVDRFNDEHDAIKKRFDEWVGCWQDRKRSASADKQMTRADVDELITEFVERFSCDALFGPGAGTDLRVHAHYRGLVARWSAARR